MVNNFEHIKPLLSFPNEDTFYFLQIIQRKKDFKKGQISGANNNSRLIKAYFVKSIEYLESKEEEIIGLCKLLNARAMVHLQPRSFERIAFQTLKQTTDNIINGNFDKVHKVFTSACGKFGIGEKKWIIDLDGEESSELYMSFVVETIDFLRPAGGKVIATLPSKNGKHLITSPFELNKFKERFPKIDVHKNNPVNLYIP